MRYLKHYFKTIRIILSAPYSYSRISLLLSYLKLIYKSVVYHKIISKKEKLATGLLDEELVGFRIRFLSYSQLVNLFEEIFIFQVYKFSYPRQSPFIIDCGSNIGLTVLYFKKVYPSCKILAFEPDSESFILLSDNIRRNNLSDVTIFNFALHDKEDKVALYKKASSVGSLNMSLIESQDHTQKQMVYAKKLSYYIRGEVDLIKIDVEGSEIKIISNLIDSKKIRLVRQMIIEYHPHLTGIPVEEFITSISACEFSCHYDKDQLHPGAAEVIVQCMNNQ